jgi:hypothetical protein
MFKAHFRVVVKLHTLLSNYSVTYLILHSGSDGNVDVSKASVLAGTARLLDLCGDVPVECIMYLLAGHCGADDVVFANDDPSWTNRREEYDYMTAGEAFDLARKERVRLRLDATIKITSIMLAIVAAGNGWPVTTLLAT